MPANEPTILATSGGIKSGGRTVLEFDKLVHYAVELSGVADRKPRICYIGTAQGDDRTRQTYYSEAAEVAGWEFSSLRLFPMPPVADVADFVLSNDVIWVGGGSVANLLALWDVHGIGEIMHKAWHAGIVLGGVSAGSICWHSSGTTDSFGPELRIVKNGLGFLPYGNGVHYDSEERRRPLIHEAVASGELPLTYCTDDGAGLLYRGTELVEAVSERKSGGAYLVRRDEATGEAVEETLDIRRL